ncbi:MAG: glycosyltransferase family 4 protein [bacterium]|nr:glycosyltransferase family 4 protein [bacterium]
MRVINFSLDRSALQEGSLAQKRLAALAAAVGEIVVLVPSGKSGKIRQFFDLWRRAERVLRDKKFDLITVQDTAYLALLAYLLARTARVPFEVQVHGFEKLYGARKLLSGFVLRRADKIRVVSERLKRELIQRFTFNALRFYVLPVYTQMGAKGQMGERGTSKTFTFLTVGRLVPVKNIALQIRAFARIAKEFPQAQLVIVGDGPERENLPRNDNVIFEGAQKDLSRFYQNADAFLLTSNSEGWGVVITEAAAYGLPIIMTDVGLACEFIKNGENGIVIPVGDEDALVYAMKRIIEDAELRTILGRGAQKAFLALPTPEEYVKKQVLEWSLV